MELLELTTELASIDTSSRGSSDIAAIIRGFVPGAEIATRSSASPGSDADLILIRKGSGQARVLLLGHYDTVFILGGSYGRVGDRLYGTGVFDMKGGLAIALKLFREADTRDFACLEFLICGDEETRTRPLVHPGRWDAIFAFEGGEPGGLVVSRFGASKFELNLIGEPLRATFPLEGTSVIDQVASAIPLLEADNQQSCHFTAAYLEAASTCNVVSPEATIGGVLRYESTRARDSWLANVDRNIGQVSCQELIPPLQKTSQSTNLLADAGISGISRTGSSDIAWLQGQAPVMIDGLGPFGGGEHSLQEFIDIRSLESQYRMAIRLMALVCRTGDYEAFSCNPSNQ